MLLPIALPLLPWTLGPPQEELAQYPAFGVSYMDLIHDIDGDGTPEILVGDHRWPNRVINGTLTQRGRIYVLSSASGAHLFEYQGTGVDSEIGRHARVVGDLTGDRVDDYAATGFFETLVFDGTSGQVVHQLPFGVGQIERIGDVNGDGLADLFFGGGVVLSGADLQHLYSAQGASNVQRAAVLGDVTGDGIADFALGSPFNVGVGRVTVHSGSDGALLYELAPPYDTTFCQAANFGEWVSAIGDISGDGVPDVVVGAPGLLPSPGTSPPCLWNPVYFFKGHDGEKLTVFPPQPLDKDLGMVIEELGDVNGNGFGDVLVWVRVQMPTTEERYYRIVDGSTKEVLAAIPLAVSFPWPNGGGADWNNDGFPDYVLGTLNGLFLFSGAPDGVTAITLPCPQSEGPRIGVTGSPEIGRHVPIHVSNVGPGLQALLLLGLDAPQPPPASRLQGSTTGTAVPCPIVRPSDRRYLATAHLVRPGEGVATVEVAIPDDIGLVGSVFYAQWLVRGSSRSLSDLSFSRILQFVVQPGGTSAVSLGSAPAPTSTTIGGR